jgi:predicted phosphoribosyltransferase
MLARYNGMPGLIVLGLARGGVPVASEVARALQAPLEVLVVRKLALPSEPEFAVGAIASGGVCVVDRELVRLLKISPRALDEITRREQLELERRERVYRRGTACGLEGHPVILVDDGLATGASIKAAVAALRGLRPSRIVVAVPVASRKACEALRPSVDELICAEPLDSFVAVGVWYERFNQTTDEEVRGLLQAVNGPAQAGAPPRDPFL